MKESELAGLMWAQACDLIDQAERLHRQFFRITSARQRAASWEPPVDVFETDNQVMIYVALPGVAAEHVQVVLEGDVLAVAGVRLIPESGHRALIHRLEIPQGRFERHIRLPTPSMKVVQSEINNGCLTVTLDKL